MRTMKSLLYIQLLQLQPVYMFKEAGRAKKIAINIAVFFLGLLTLPSGIITILLPAIILTETGHTAEIVAAALALASFVIVFTTIARTPVIFSNKDWSLLASLPIPTWQIVASKMLFLYFLCLLIAAMLMLPQIIFQQLVAPVGVLTLLVTLLLVFVTPLIPFVIGTSIGIGGYLLIQKIPRLQTRHLTFLFTVFLLCVIVFGTIFLIPTLTALESNPTSVLLPLAHVLRQGTRLYLPAWLLLPDFIPTQLLGLVLFITLSLILFASFFAFINANYRKLCASMQQKQTRVKKAPKSRQLGHLPALLRKEIVSLAQYPTLLLNVVFSYVLLLFFCGVLLFVDLGSLHGFLVTELDISIDPALYPVLYASTIGFFIVVLAQYASAAFSLEGKAVWLLQTLPFPFPTILDAKLYTSLLMQLLLIPLVLLVLAFKQLLQPADLALLALWIFAYAAFTTLTSLWINFLLPKYNWKSETEVTKQSTAALVASLAHLALLIVFSLIASLELIPLRLFFPIQIVVMLIISLLIFLWLRRQQFYLKPSAHS